MSACVPCARHRTVHRQRLSVRPVSRAGVKLSAQPVNRVVVKRSVRLASRVAKRRARKAGVMAAAPWLSAQAR
ncbi:hypothetical protein D3C81_1674440 [compost metagenome]